MYRNKQGDKMKTRSIIVGVLCMVLSAGAETQYRDFMSAEGQVIRGRVMKYDAKKRAVTIQRDNKKMATVPLSILSKDDQAYILEWEFNKIFLSESSLKIEVKREKRKDKEESYGSFIHTKKVEHAGYKLSIQNKSTSKLKNLEVQYCIFYEQQKNSNGKLLDEQGVKYGSIDIPILAPKSTKEISTETVTIYKEEMDSDYTYSSGAANTSKGKVHGIWVRVIMKLTSGETLARSYCLPDSLNNKRVWKKSSVNVGMNSSKRKR
jgi:hypothetical protein